MTWLSPAACRENRMRRELLNKSLLLFFDIEGELIELTDDRKIRRCLFKVQDESQKYLQQVLFCCCWRLKTGVFVSLESPNRRK